MRLGKYELIKELGTGEVGTVYFGRDTVLDRDVAVKILHPHLIEDQHQVEQFRENARVLAKLNHPNIVSIYELDEIDGRTFIVMDYMPGGNLLQKLKNGRIGQESAAVIIHDLGKALTYLHEQGFAHGNIRPENILFDVHEKPMLSDFAIRNLLSEQSSTTLDLRHLYSGKSSESHLMQEAAEFDLTSISAVYYEMLTGRRPREGQLKKIIESTQTISKTHDIYEIPQTDLGIVIQRVENTIFRKERDFKDNQNKEIEKPGHLGNRLHRVAEFITTLLHKNYNSDKVEQVLKILIDDNCEMEFLRIPEGVFVMGSDPKVDPYALPDERPQHKVRLSEYWIGKTPVTRQQYALFTQNGRGVEFYENTDLLPVDDITWKDAKQFCQWLSLRSNQQIDLPTEAQWEKAARGTNGSIYPWGSNPPTGKHLNAMREVNSPQAVGSFPAGASPYGVLELIGNVWEWTSDWYDNDYYARSEKSDPLGAGIGKNKVVRGGPWTGINTSRAANRESRNPEQKSRSIGFRCVLIKETRKNDSHCKI